MARTLSLALLPITLCVFDGRSALADPGQAAPGEITSGEITPGEITPGEITWTTYLYQGPSPRFSVIGEVPQATKLDVGPCRDGWCAVSYEGRSGYVMAEVIAMGDPSKPAPGLLPQPAAALMPQPAGPCFEVNQKGGNGGNALTIVCAK